MGRQNEAVDGTSKEVRIWRRTRVLILVLLFSGAAGFARSEDDSGRHLEVGRLISSSNEYGSLNGYRLGAGWWSDYAGRDRFLSDCAFWASGQSGGGTDLLSTGFDFGFLSLRSGPVSVSPRVKLIGLEFRRTPDHHVLGVGIGAGAEAGILLGRYAELAVTADCIASSSSGMRSEVGVMLRLITKRGMC